MLWNAMKFRGIHTYYYNIMSTHSVMYIQYHIRRNEDAANDWIRIECTDGFNEKSQQLLMRLTSINETFIDLLPTINSSSLVIPGQFIFSCNDNKAIL